MEKGGDMAGESVPREEFDLFCRQQNGSLKRIETSLATINNKLDGITQETNERVTWEAHDRHKEDCKQEFSRLRGRPSWAVAFVLTFLCSACASMLVLVLTGVLR